MIGMNSNTYISVVDAARFYNVTTTTIYNQLKSGELVGCEINRGDGKRGWLVCKPNGFNEWEKTQTMQEDER